MKSNLLKKGTSILLSMLMLVSCIGTGMITAFAEEKPAHATTGKCGENVTWNLDVQKGKITISGEGETYDYNNFYIASQIDFDVDDIYSVEIQDGVTHIGNSLFAYCNRIKSLILPDTIKTIGDYAFYGCGLLRDVKIPDSVESVGSYAFDRFDGFEIGNGLKKIGVKAFGNMRDYGYDAVYYNNYFLGVGSRLYDSELDNFEIKPGTTVIADEALRGAKFKSVTIPDSVSLIPNGMFYNCYNLKSVIIPDSVTSIGTYAFSTCRSLTDISIPSGVTDIGRWVFYDCRSLTNITLPDSLKSINDKAFYNCSSLTKITIPDEVTYIGEYAFESCSNLTDISLGSNIETIGYFAFAYCYKLARVDISSMDSWYKIEFDSLSSNPVYYSNAMYLNGSLVTDVIIPDNITHINPYCFSGNEELKSVTIPKNVTEIGESAFELCTGLNEIKIPNSVREIGGSAFEDCTSLTDVELPDSIENIGTSLFENCSSLIYITIPKSVKEIGNSAFEDCTSLTDVELPEGIEKIGMCAFMECTALTEITIPKSVKEIGEGVFYECTSLTDVELPEGIEKIESCAFMECTALTEITIPKSVKEIGNSAFAYCTSLTGVELPEGVEKIEDAAFGLCTNLKTAKIGEGITEIPENLFMYCYSLSEVTIPEGVKVIGSYAFAYCAGLKNINIPDSVEIIGFESFVACPLEKLNIPKNVREIDETAFAYNYIIDTEEAEKVLYENGFTFEDYYLEDNAVHHSSYGIFLQFYELGLDLSQYIIGATQFTVSEENQYYTTDDYGMLYTKDFKVYYPTYINASDYKFADEVEVIAPGTFAYNNKIKTVTIPDSVKYIDGYSFYYCPELTSIVIGKGVEEIDGDFFYECPKLKDIYYCGSEEEWLEKFGSYENDYGITVHFNYVPEVAHNHTLSHIVVPATCTVDGMEYDLCTDCGETLNSNVILATGHSYTSEITTPATCKDEGVKTFTCACGDTYTEKIEKLTTHTWGEWVRTTEPTTTLEGTDTRKCTVCDKTETRTVEKLKVLADEKTGVEIVFENEFDKDVTVEVSEVFDGTSFQLINTNFGDVKSAIFDISTEKDGNKVQPNGKIKVRIPVPADFTDGKLFVVYLDTTNGTTTKIPVTVSDGYAEFETDHFSQYALVCQSDAPAVAIDSVEIDNAKINYKQNAKLVTRIDAADDAELTVKYESSDPSIVTVDDNGNIYGAKKGTATITFTVTDQNGYSVSDTCTVTVGYTWWQNIIRIVLFGWLWY